MFQFEPRRRALLAAAAAMTTLALAGCGKEKKLAIKGSDISGTHLGSDLAMVDQDGKLRTLADYKNKIPVVFFGFTHCPDVCPTALAQLAQAMELLKNDAAKVQGIMITVDPARDTPEVMGRYVKAFNPSFTGLSGSPEQLAKTAKSFRAFYARAAGATPDEYSMDHSSSFYILDQQGEARILLPGNASAQTIADDIRQLL